MKIGLVTQHFAPHFEGGTEAVVRAQARALSRRGHEVHVVSGTDRPFTDAEGGASREEVDGLRVDFLHRRPDEVYDLILERPRLARRVRELCADDDVVHLHHWTTLDNSLVRTLSAGGRPVVVSLHDHFTSCPRFFRIPVGVERCPAPVAPDAIAPCVACCAVEAPLPEVELTAGLAARARTFAAELAAASAVVAPSDAHKAALERALGPALPSTFVIPHGLSRGIEPAPAPADSTPLRILHLGHRSTVKGTLDLVQAIAALPEARRREVWLLCLGAEVEPGFDDRVRAAAGDARVALEGAYDVAALSKLVTDRGGAHLAAFPSRAPESYGLVVDEALALGLPCLVADSGALPERLGGAGRVLPAGDPPAWTRALNELFDDPATLERWRAALPGARPSADQAAANLTALYERVRA